MTYRMTIIHRVADYSAWEALLRRYPRPTRSGLVRRSAYRSTDDPNEVMVELEVESVEVAQSVLKGQNLHDLLDRAGIEFYPPVFIGEQVDELGF
jgi:sortase (surface protein transpeptidase)